jgi:hypothetical protein
MQVSELIELLKRIPAGKEVFVELDGYEHDNAAIHRLVYGGEDSAVLLVAEGGGIAAYFDSAERAA